MGRLAEFAELVARPVLPLDRTLAVLGAVVRPDQDPDAVVAGLDELAAACTSDDPTALCAELFGPGGLGPAGADYYDPASSVLGEVLQRRRGIPISLAVVALEVGRRRGVGLRAIGMPGHFLLRSADDVDRFLDPYDGGRACTRSDCRAVFEALHPGGVPFLEEYLEPVPDRAVVARVVQNLLVASARQGDRELQAVVRRAQLLLSRTAFN